MDDTNKENAKDTDNEEIEQENSKKHDITMEDIEYESKRRKPNDSQGPHSLESGVSSAEVSSNLSHSENVSSHESIMEEITQLQEEVKSKKLSIEALQSENNSLRLQNSSKLSNPDKNSFQQYKKKIEEYQAAVSQRDSVINQLQDRLTQCIQQQEYLTESAQQAEHFSREIETLKLQLKEATDFLGNQKWLSGVNPKEHMELKHKLISIQQERTQDQAMISQLSQQMHTKTEAYGHLDHKYKMILRNHKQMLDNYKSEAAKHNSEMQQLSVEREGFENRMKEEIAKLEKQHEDTIGEAKQKSVREMEDFVSRLSKASEDYENKNRELEESKEKSSKEIQDLMHQLQTLTQELSASRQEHSDLLTSIQKENSNQLVHQRATLEEQFGQEITVIKQQMSAVHQEELTKMKQKHESDLNEVTKQIDTLERVQKEDSQAMVGNLETLCSLNQGLKQQLDAEKGKVESLERQLAELVNIKEKVEKYAEKNNSLEEQLKDEQNKQQNLKKLYNSIKNNSMKEHSELQEQMLYQGEQRLKLEELLAEEQQKVKELSEQKDLLEKDIKNYSDVNLQLTAECNNLKATKDDVNKQLQQIEVNLKQVKDQFNERKEKCEMYEKAYKELKQEKETWVREKEAHLIEKENISKINIEFQKLEESIKEEIQARIQLSKEKEDMSAEFTQLENKFQELSQYQVKCYSLTQKVTQIVMNIDAKEQKLNILKDLKEIYLTICNDCDLHMSNRQKFAEIYNEKCLKISENIKSSSNHKDKLDPPSKECDNPPAKSLSTQEEKEKVLEELKEVNKINCNLKSENDTLNKVVEEIRSQNEALEIKLTDNKCQIESLSTEMKQAQLHCKTMEQEKNEVEMERDQLMEQYRVLEAEYSNTIMKLDREVQLVSQHAISSDVGVNVATSMSDHETTFQCVVSESKHKTPVSDSCLEQPSAVSDNSSVEGDLLVEEVLVDPEVFHPTSHLPIAGEPVQRNVKKQSQDLLKDEKSLLNEIEKLKITVDEQHYAIGSLENENSSLKITLKQLKLEKSNRINLVGKYQQEVSEKLKFQHQVEPEMEVKVQEIVERDRIIEEKIEQIEQQNKILVEIQITLDEKQKQIAELESSLRDATDKVVKLTQELENSCKVVQSLAEEVGSRDKDIVNLKKELKHRDKKIKDLVNELKEAMDMLRKAKWEAETSGGEDGVKEMAEEENEVNNHYDQDNNTWSPQVLCHSGTTYAASVPSSATYIASDGHAFNPHMHESQFQQATGSLFQQTYSDSTLMTTNNTCDLSSVHPSYSETHLGDPRIPAFGVTHTLLGVTQSTNASSFADSPLKDKDRSMKHWEALRNRVLRQNILHASYVPNE